MGLGITVIKTILSVLACKYLFHLNILEAEDIEDLIGRIAVFVLIYGICSFFALLIGGSINNGDDVYENGRHYKIVYGLDIKLIFIPVIALLVLFWIFGKIFGENGTTVVGGIVLVASLGFIIIDIISIIRMFTGIKDK